MGLRVTCKHCGGAHPAYECRKKSTASRKDENAMCLYEADAVATKSVHPGEADGTAGVVITQKVISGVRFSDPAGTQALPVDTNAGSLNGRAANFQAADGSSILPPASKTRGRPRTITDMKLYKAMKQREYRARKKNG